jgi:hypothetical protein
MYEHITFYLVRSKLEYASVVWNFVTSIDANKPERIQQKLAALCFNGFFSHVHYSCAYALQQLKLTPYVKVGITVMHCSFFKFTSASVLLVRKLLVFEFLLGISETFLCSVSALLVKIVLMLDVPQLLKLSVDTSMYLEPKLFLFVYYIICTL